MSEICALGVRPPTSGSRRASRSARRGAPGRAATRRPRRGCAYAGYVLLAGRVDGSSDVWWDPPADESLSIDGEVDWVGDQAGAPRRPAVGGPVLVVAKSLGTRARGSPPSAPTPAIWLTPLLSRARSSSTAIRANPARQLLVGGTDDDLWDADVAASLAADGCDVLQLDGADHGLMTVDGDPVRSAEILVEITRAMARFVAGFCPLLLTVATTPNAGIPGRPGTHRPGRLSAGARPASRRRCWRGRRRGPR